MKKEFLLKQYEVAVEERKELIRTMGLLERSCLIGSGLIWSWGFTHSINITGIDLMIWMIPLLINGLGALRVYALNQQLENCEDFLRNQEKQIEDEQGFFVHAHKRAKKKRKTLLGYSAYAFWITLILVSIIALVVAIYPII